MESAAENKTALEKERVAMLQKGDKRVLAALYESYSAALYNLIFRIVGSEEKGKEVLQDSFLKIWNDREKYDPAKSRLFTWMAQIARETAIERVRSGELKKSDKTEYVENGGGLSEERLSQEPDLRKILKALDEKNWKIIDLLYFHDFTQKEVSEMLGIPVGIVKSSARKAVTALRKVLKN